MSGVNRGGDLQNLRQPRAFRPFFKGRAKKTAGRSEKNADATQQTPSCPKWPNIPGGLAISERRREADHLIWAEICSLGFVAMSAACRGQPGGDIQNWRMSRAFWPFSEGVDRRRQNAENGPKTARRRRRRNTANRKQPKLSTVSSVLAIFERRGEAAR